MNNKNNNNFISPNRSNNNNNNDSGHHHPRQGNNLQPQAVITRLLKVSCRNQADQLWWPTQWLALSSEIKLPEHEAKHSLPSGAEV
jgi:hypothetical protein